MHYAEVCPDCSAGISTKIAQHFLGDKLVWSRARLCERCGLAEAADTADAGMAYFRNILISGESFGVEFERTGEGMETLRGALAHVTAASIDTSEAVCRALVEGRWRGTRPEAAWVVSVLADEGIFARTVRRSSHN